MDRLGAPRNGKGPASVSYTHLDVYKRQLQHLSSLLEASRMGKWCYVFRFWCPATRGQMCIRDSGIDMFDCVLPTRLGRNGSLYTTYGRINIKNNKYITDFGPVDPELSLIHI